MFIQARISQKPVLLKLTHQFLSSSSFQGRARRREVVRDKWAGKKFGVEGSKLPWTWPDGEVGNVRGVIQFTIPKDKEKAFTTRVPMHLTSSPFPLNSPMSSRKSRLLVFPLTFSFSIFFISRREIFYERPRCLHPPQQNH